MAIIVERTPHIVVTDDQSGWSLTGGRSDGDGASTKEMTHVNGAKCTVRMIDVSRTDAELALRVTGMLFLNAGEETGAFILKEPKAGDFVTAPELYAIAGVLIRAWYEAAFSKLGPLTIRMPTRPNH